MALVIDGITYNKATIAIMKQRQIDRAKMEAAPAYRGMSNGKARIPGSKISHAERKARIVSHSIANDPKNTKNKKK